MVAIAKVAMVTLEAASFEVKQNIPYHLSLITAWPMVGAKVMPIQKH